MSFVVKLCPTSRTDGDLLEQFHLGIREVAPSPELQSGIVDRTDRNARELIDRVADGFEHVANLAVSPFVNGDLQRGVSVVAPRDQSD